MNMNAIVVKIGEIPVVKEFSSIKAMTKEIGIASKEDWETMLFNEGKAPYEEIGIIARDQDKRLKKNILGLKGSFIICGYTRTSSEAGTFHQFTSLTEEQTRLITKQLARSILFNRLSS